MKHFIYASFKIENSRVLAVGRSITANRIRVKCKYLREAKKLVRIKLNIWVTVLAASRIISIFEFYFEVTLLEKIKDYSVNDKNLHNSL